MAITKSDIKLLESQELSDAITGGGLMTQNEVVDGSINNLFADISRLDRTTGRVSLRKAFAAVQTADSAEYFGSHAIIAAPATDAAVDVTMFSTSDDTDKRPSAQAEIESYVIQSTAIQQNLFGVHPAGISQITLISIVGQSKLIIGETYKLVEDFELAGEFGQFVKISGITITTTVFTDSLGSYSLDLIVLDITEPLLSTFHGGVQDRYTVYRDASTTVFSTTSSAASRYYGIRPVSASSAALDTTINVNSIFAQVTPAAQSESILADAIVGGELVRPVQSGNTAFGVRINYDLIADGVTQFSLGSGVIKGSVVVSGHVSATENDDGTFSITSNTGNWVRSITIDYVAGVVSLVGNTTITLASQLYATFTFKPATAISDVSDTAAIDVTTGTRALNYVKTLNPIPAPFTLYIDYMAQGNWIRLSDINGDGILGSETTGVGAGTVNFTTGTVSVTLGALPDVGSKILFGWGGTQHYEIRSDAEVKESYIEHTVPEAAIVPLSLTITWMSGGVTKTATDDGLGAISGDATGGVIYSTGEVGFLPATLPDPNATITYDYDYGVVEQEVFTPTRDGAGNITLNMTNASAIKPNSVEVTFDLTTVDRTHTNIVKVRWDVSEGISRYDIDRTSSASTTRANVSIIDDGAGSFGYDTSSSITYTANGVIIISPQLNINHTSYSPLPSYKNWSTSSTLDYFVDASTVTVNYILDSATPTTAQSTIPSPSLLIYLCPTVENKVIPKSMRFTLSEHTYIDRLGSVYRYPTSDTSGAGTLSGTIDYASSLVTLTDWGIYVNGWGTPQPGTSTIAVQSLLTQYGDWTNYETLFRTAGAPLRPASFFVSANKASDGTLMSDSADQNGILYTADLAGTIDVNNGIARIRYGRLVTAAGNETQDWYDILNLEYDEYGALTGEVWQPEYVVPNSSIYNAVIFSSIPVDASIVGINPARLPSDGRVPIFNKGGVVVIHETESESMPVGLIAAQSVVLTNTDYSLIELYDQDKKQVDFLLYTVDLATSTVTMASPLDLSAYSEPLVAYKRLEDMKVLSDVQINGELSLTSQLSNAYTPAAFVSSALLFGDLASRYNTLFDQATWTGVFSDELIGTQANGTYNDLSFPLLIQNDSAIKERWALQFTSSTGFNIIGEKVGIIGTGTIASNVAPINIISGLPYFTLDFNGFGAGWSTGNAIRFNTTAANSPIWFNRTTMPSNDTLDPTDAS